MAELAVNSVIDMLVPLLTEEVKLLRGVHDDITTIKDLLEIMRSFFKDADARAARANSSSGLKNWVKQTREIATRIEDVIDEYIHHVALDLNKHGLSGFLHKTIYCVRGLVRRHEIASEIQILRKRVSDVRVASAEYGFNVADRISFSSSRQDDLRMDSHFTEEAELVGIAALKNELIRWSIRGDVESKLSISSLVGMGGMGKTTIAKKVYDDAQFTRQFPFRAWITVSQSYNIDDVRRNLITEFHKTMKESDPEGIKTMNGLSLVKTLREYLMVKRYALVLDDVWDPKLWDCVKHALPNNDKGSRIIITTRHGEVAAAWKEGLSHQVHNIEPLSPDMAWELFSKKTFRDSKGTCPRELKQFAKAIVSRCGGLPLAIIAISGLLLTRGKEMSQWKKLHDNLGAELEFNPHLANVTKILSFSYDDLPYQLKPCFLYFGTYPKSCSIRCSRIIRQWIAEGFIMEHGEKPVEDVAEEYLTELIQRNLVQVSSVDEKGIRRHCQVHDVMWEAVVNLKAEDLRFSHFLKEDSRVLANTRHLSAYSSACNVLGGIEASFAHSLIIFNGVGEPQNLLTACSKLHRRFKHLRVLDFEESLLDILPEEVGYIYHLKYLSLRNTRVKMLPKSMGKLVNLETLDLKQSLIYEIPVEINKLPKLRNLLAYNRDYNKAFSMTTQRAVKIHDGMKRWDNLQKLYSVEATNSLVRDLGTCKQLRRLSVQNLTREQWKDLSASLEKMSHLQSLAVYAVDQDELIDMQFSSSSPLQFIRTLSLNGLLGILPDWIAGLGFLTRLVLGWSGLAGDRHTLRVLQELPNLLDLYIHEAFSCDELHFEKGFPKLKSLSLRNLNGLRLMKIHKGTFPHLESLHIGPSPQMQQVPSGIRNLGNLKTLYFYDMPSNFIDRIPAQETVVKIGPTVFFVKTEGKQFRTFKVVRGVAFD